MSESINKKYNLVVLSENEEFKKRANYFSKQFDVVIHFFQNADIFVEQEEIGKNTHYVVLDATKVKNHSDVAGMVQTAKFVAPNSGIAVIVEKKIETNAAEFIKKSGASVVLLEDEYFQGVKVEFYFSRQINGEWIPIKVADLIKNKEVSFTLFHMMPLNGKFLPVLQKGQLLDDERYKKYLATGELYIKRIDLDTYREYAKNFQDASAAGLARRCRAVYIGLSETYKDLVTLLTDRSEASSFKEGKALFEKLMGLATELISSLGALGEAWDVVNNASFNDLTAVDRAPAIASYAGLFSLILGIGKPEEVMVSALIADIGLLDLNPETILKLKNNSVSSMSDDELKEYHFHPIRSLNRVLERKVPVPESMKQIIVCTHEQPDQKGFPNKPVPDKIPKESYLIHFSEVLDQKSILKFGQSRMNPVEARNKLVDEEIKMGGTRFPADFLMEVKKI